MTSLKMGLAVAIAVVVASFAAAGTASATVLCKEAKIPCGAADYPAFTPFAMEQMPGNTTLWKKGFLTIDTCENATVGGTTQNTGGSGTAVTVKLSTFTWGTCGITREVTALGNLEIKYTSEGRGTLFLTQLVWKEGSCVYGGKFLAHIGVITKPEAGKTYSTLLIDTTYPLISGSGCTATVTFASTNKVTFPTPLYIADS